MGYSADAHLIWGVVISAYDEDGEPTPFWDEDEGDWVDLGELVLAESGLTSPWKELPDEINHGTNEQFAEWKASNPEWVKRSDEWFPRKHAAEKKLNIRIAHFGHCDDPDGPHAILTSTRVKQHDGDCWTPTKISSWDGIFVTDKAVSRAREDCQRFNLPCDFFDAEWWLVASYG